MRLTRQQKRNIGEVLDEGMSIGITYGKRLKKGKVTGLPIEEPVIDIYHGPKMIRRVYGNSDSSLEETARKVGDYCEKQNCNVLHIKNTDVRYKP